MPVQRRSKLLICVIILIATLAAYWNVWSYDFISYDDPRYVSRNRIVQEGLSWDGWWYAWTEIFGSWNPLTWLSLELDGTFWGGNPAGYHITNLVLHVANALLLFLILNRLTGSLYRSACVAMFFAIHPLHVESVAWISERKDVLSTAFLLLTVWAYAHYAARPSAGRYWTVLILFACGLLAKPMLVTLPVLLLLLDYWPLNRAALQPPDSGDSRCPKRSIRALVLEKIPLLAMSFADGLVTLLAQEEAYGKLQQTGLLGRFWHMFHAYTWYLQKTFVPTDLILVYPHPEQGLSWSQIAIGVVVVIGISIWVIWRAKVAPFLIMGWGWFVISALPVIGLIQVGIQAYADRYSYIPHLGLLVAIVWQCHAWFGRSRPRRIASAVVAIAAMIGCGVLTHRQVGYWKNSEVLWTHVLDVSPDNYVAHDHLGSLRYSQGDFQRASEHMQRTLRNKEMKRFADVYYNLGICFVALNRFDEAESRFQQALKVDRNHDGALSEYAKLLHKLGRHAEAAPLEAQYANLLRVQQLAGQAEQNPDSESSQLILGYRRVLLGNYAAAIPHFEKAIHFEPNSAAAYANLGLCQAKLKRFTEARKNLLRGLELDPNSAAAHAGLAELLESEGDLAGAKQHYEESLRLNPLDAATKERLERLTNP